MKAILVMVEKENTQVHGVKTILDAEKDGQPCAVLVLANGTAVVVNESAASMRAMLAEPVADDRTPADLAIDGWRATISADGQPDREIVGIEPLDSACVRVLPTPQGARRFLCLPEVDRSKPAEHGDYLGHAYGYDKIWPDPPGLPWNKGVHAGYARVYGPLPTVAP